MKEEKIVDKNLIGTPKSQKELKIWRKLQDEKGINWRKVKTRTCRVCQLTYSTITTRKKHQQFFCQPLKKTAFSFKEQNELNREQLLAKESVLQGKSVLLTGSAGTGKSFILGQIITDLQQKYNGERVGITAMTGTGANVIGGATLHSYLGIGTMGNFSSEVLMTTINRSPKAQKNWKNLRVLIIDEVSMLDGELFDKLEMVARQIRRNHEPFGGIQLVLIGDFCQLPPAGKTVSLYTFEAQTWSKCISEIINLKQIYRQKNDWFISYLQAIRFGRLSKKRWEDMLNRLGREPEWPSDGIKPTSLFATNSEVGRLNEEELVKLPEKSFFFMAQDKEKLPGKLELLIKSCLAPKKLELKVGAQVMLIRNLKDGKFVNGSQGIVVSFKSGGKPVVRFTNGRELAIGWETWERIEGYDAKNRPIVSATRWQIPLILAWGITITKCQGQSVERLKVDLKKCWMAGQVYVALSRATDPNYLQIINFAYNRLWCDPKVRKFYEALEAGQDYSTSLPTTKKKDWHKVYLKEKIRVKWKEFLTFYENSQKWPYKEIKKLINSSPPEYFPIFIRTVEKSISNSHNLPLYRKLIENLQNWWAKQSQTEKR